LTGHGVYSLARQTLNALYYFSDQIHHLMGNLVDAGKVGAYTLGDDEKAVLKQFLLSHMEETDQKVAAQLAVLVADTARKDWPKNWNELFPSLMATVHHQASALSLTLIDSRGGPMS
jgi:hypothetical protein